APVRSNRDARARAGRRPHKSRSPARPGPRKTYSDSSLIPHVVARERGERGLAAFFERRGDELHFAPAAVLRELPARLEAHYRNAEVDDGSKHALDVFASQRVELGQPLRIQGGDEPALRRVLRRAVLDEMRHAVRVHRGVVPRRHALGILVPARRDIGVRAAEDDERLGVVKMAPLLVGTRHVHVERQLAALLLHQRGQVRSAQAAAAAGDEHREVVLAHEGDELRSVLQPVVGWGIHYSRSATACAAMPSTRPRKPRCSVVVALMLTIAGAIPRSAAMLPVMRATCGAMRGSWAMMVASMLTTRRLRTASFLATSRRSLRLSTPRNSALVSG